MIGLYTFAIISVSSLLFLYLFGVIKVSLFKLRLCALTLCHAFKHVKFMGDQKSEKDRGRGVKQPQAQGDDYRMTVGLNQNPRNK